MLFRNRIFRQPRVKLPVAAPQTRLEQVKLLISRFDDPIEALREWSCIVVTDKGNYRNSEVVCVTREVYPVGRITIAFKPMEVIRKGNFLRLLIYDDAGRFIREHSDSIVLFPKDTLKPTYGITL